MSTGSNNLYPCDCCTGIEYLTPSDILNDAGLSSVLFRIGTHGAFKESMLMQLAESRKLHQLSTRENNDPTIALIDAWAVVLDILTFYQERIINEGYIRTATERLSLYELSKHISYHPKPGVAADTWFSFLMSESPGAPLEAVAPTGTKIQSIPEQGELAQVFETVEPIRAHTAWNAIPLRRFRAQILQKGSTRVYLQGTNHQLQAGDQLLLIGSERLSDVGSEQWDLRTIQTVFLNNEDNYTLVTWREGLGHTNPDTSPAQKPLVYVLRQRAALFGYNAPDFRNMSEEVKKTFYPNDWASLSDWKNFEIHNPSRKTIFLDAVYPKVLDNSWLVLSNPYQVELYRVEYIEPGARKNFSLASKTSKVRLDTDEHLHEFGLRETVVLAQSEALPPAEAPIYTPLMGDTFEITAVQPALKNDQYLILSGEVVDFLQVRDRTIVIKVASTEEEAPSTPLRFYGQEESVEVRPGDILQTRQKPPDISGNTIRWYVQYRGIDGYIDAQEDDLLPYQPPANGNIPELPTSINQPRVIKELIQIKNITPIDEASSIKHYQEIKLHTPLRHFYWRHTVTINANVARGTHGESKTEILGSGNGRQVFQKFNLKQKPLTHISASTASGLESTLEVRVNDIKWQEVPSLYSRSPEERSFISRIEEDGTVYVQFGDGITGRRLPSGSENIRATYRIGTGLAGKLKPDQLSLLLTPQLGIQSVSNPLGTTGGEDPESLSNIRRNAPLTVLALDRIVSIKDYEDFANAFAGIGKALADLIWEKEDRKIHLTVAAADGDAVAEDQKKKLLNAISAARDGNIPVVIQSFSNKRFGVEARLRIERDYIPEKVISQARKALATTFSFASRGFGQGVTPSEIIAVLQTVAGTSAVDLEYIIEQSLKYDPFHTEHFRLTASRATWDGINILPAELLTIDPDRLFITSWTDETQ